DEALGRNGVTDANYNDFQISLLKKDDLNVLTIHAEAEGGRCAPMFEDYLKRVLAAGYRVIPLGLAAQEAAPTAPAGNMILADFPGREGQLAIQS
ncbi:MAG: 4-deoxy-4-formamido-L-arabinose-phosphoundecaprenol deformylase, partial [Lentisphaeria bacterium]|nr:4-deoxy-4-formamido-L-arabinose-phosphoundecaprenol deformylase [Lentisphaeria bacterium]